MTAHSNVSKVQEDGCAALAQLAYNNDANRVSIEAKRGIEAIVSAMTVHSNVSRVQEEGWLALFNLTDNKSVAVRIQLLGDVAVLGQNPSNSDAERALQRIRGSLKILWFLFVKFSGST
jgi:hypothetical protein